MLCSPLRHFLTTTRCNPPLLRCQLIANHRSRVDWMYLGWSLGVSISHDAKWTALLSPCHGVESRSCYRTTFPCLRVAERALRCLTCSLLTHVRVSPPLLYHMRGRKLQLRAQSLGHLRIVLKEELKQLPGFGWGMQLFMYIYLSRTGGGDVEWMSRVLR